MKVRAALVLVIAIALAAFLIAKLRSKKSETAVGDDPAAVSFLKSADPSPTATGGVASTSPAPAIVGTPADHEKLNILNQILAAHNDNDLRLDRDFNELTPAAKELMETRYRELPIEKRNQRGTVVFLLGRNLTQPQDFEFFKEILREPPCKSLGDCSKDPPPATREELHEEMGTGITLAYPQMVALNQIQKFLDQAAAQGGNPQLTAQAIQTLEAAEKSNVDLVSRKAAELLRTYRR